MKRVSITVSGFLIGAALLLGGCGGSAEAAEAVEAAPAAPAPVAQAVPVVQPANLPASNVESTDSEGPETARTESADTEGADTESAASESADTGDSGADVSVTGPRPDLPRKAPVFHQSGAKRILPSRLVIPAISVDTPVVELGWNTTKTASGSIFSEWDVAEYAAGWHKNSAVPGEGGNVVMSGHNNILGSVFRELDQLKRGDTLEVFLGGEEHVYTVEEVLILPEKHASNKQRKANVQYIQETADDRLTLVSCWPRDDNTHRIVVVAKPQVN
jgi:LPXTG-site transpeptidase (sortase) family protein